MHTRRHLLVAVGAAAAAGCTGSLGSESDGRDGSGDADRVRLEELSVQNNHGEDHSVLLAVEADDEMLHLGTYDLDGDGGTRTVDGEWTEDAGSYRVHARLDDGEIQTVDLTEGVGSDCVRVLIRIDDGGDLAVWNGSDCGTDADPDAGDFESA